MKTISSQKPIWGLTRASIKISKEIKAANNPTKLYATPYGIMLQSQNRPSKLIGYSNLSKKLSDPLNISGNDLVSLEGRPLIINPGIKCLRLSKCFRSIIRNGLDGSSILLLNNNIEVLDKQIFFPGKNDDLQLKILEADIKYNELYNSIPEVLFEINSNMVITKINNSITKYGYEINDVIGNSALSLIHPAYVNKAMANVLRVLKGEIFAATEYKIFKKDGTTFDALIKTIYKKEHGLRGILMDITELKHSSNKLKLSEDKFDLFFENNPLYCYMLSSEGIIKDINRSALKRFGYAKDEIIGQPVSVLYHQDSKQKAADLFVKWKETGKLRNEKLKIVTKTGDIRYVTLSVNSIKDEVGNIISSISVQTDTTELKDAHDKIKILLKEMSHRVKNNFGTIKALLSLEEQKTQDEGARHALKNSMSRILLMAKLHEKLYKSDNISSINLGSYLKDISASIFDSYNIKHSQISFETDLQDIDVSIDKIVPCGIIINEILTNSFKYAFPGDMSGRIYVKLYKKDDNNIQLVAGDNGIGLPDSLADKDSDSLGMSLINMMAKQLDGKLETVTSSVNGTEYRVLFPINTK